MATTFYRVLTAGASLSAMEFTVATESGRAELACPICAARFVLPPGVGLDADGKTSHRLRCPDQRCPFEDWCVLSEVWS